MEVADKKCLVSLGIGQWTARKQDKNAKKVVTDHYGVSNEAEVTTIKSAIAKKHLQEIKRLAGEMRTYNYKHTLPYFEKGSRVLPNEMVIEYTQYMSKAIGEFKTAVAKFMSLYPTLKEEARINLKGMYNKADYPSYDEVRDNFFAYADIKPVPRGSHLTIEVSDEELQEFRNQIEERVRQSESKELQALWDRLYTTTYSIAERLTPDDNAKAKEPKGKRNRSAKEAGDKIFRDTLIENVRSLVDIIPKLNYTKNPDIEELVNEINAEFAGLEPDELRTDRVLRAKTLAKTKVILAKIHIAMGNSAPENVDFSNPVGKSASQNAPESNISEPDDIQIIENKATESEDCPDDTLLIDEKFNEPEIEPEPDGDVQTEFKLEEVVEIHDPNRCKSTVEDEEIDNKLKEMGIDIE